MKTLSEGTWGCTITGAVYGDNDKGIATAQILGRIDDGPDAGSQFTYEDRVDAKSALYVGRSMKAVGWTGRELETLEADAASWIKKTGGKSTVEIKHIPYRDKKTNEERIWAKPNAIGRNNRQLQKPTAQSSRDANETMRRAMQGDDEGAPF